MLWSACISVAAKENGGVFNITLYKKAILPFQNMTIYYFGTIADTAGNRGFFGLSCGKFTHRSAILCPVEEVVLNSTILG
jgi:hypothetical protein